MKISDGGSTILYNIAIINESYCEKVVEEIIKQIQKEEISADTTIQMRYLGIISNIHSSGDERYSTICIKHGATDAIMKACEIPDILVQVILFIYYFIHIILFILIIIDDYFRIHTKYNVNKYWNRLFNYIISFKSN